jgi:hypothetical protein
MKVYKSGTRIEIKLNKMPAVINAVKIEMHNVIYIASYFAADEYKQVDLFEYEFNVMEDNGKQVIGFK